MVALGEPLRYRGDFYARFVHCRTFDIRAPNGSGCIWQTDEPAEAAHVKYPWQQSDNVPFEQSRNVPLTTQAMGMQEGQLLMTQAGRDRLVTLKKAKKKLIKQREATEELGLSVRQVKRLLYALKKRGDKAVVHGLRGKPSKRRIDESVQEQAVKILSAPVYEGFGPTLAAEYLAKKHGIEASNETVREWIFARARRLAQRVH